MKTRDEYREECLQRSIAPKLAVPRDERREITAAAQAFNGKPTAFNRDRLALAVAALDEYDVTPEELEAFEKRVDTDYAIYSRDPRNGAQPVAPEPEEPDEPQPDLELEE